ncbi:MAG: PD-(D/E)XK nuclease family protein [Chloroflexota bacterium]
MIQLTPAKVVTWLRCERCFQLNYVDSFNWPREPLDSGAIGAMEKGEVFHMLVAQFLASSGEFEIKVELLEPDVYAWWSTFLARVPVTTLNSDSVQVETSFEVILNSTVKLFGRIDCLKVGAKTIEIFDWKTGKPKSRSDLMTDWQTRLYLALLAESRSKLGLTDLPLDHISITYWYSRDPNQSVKISYNKTWHTENWQEIVTIADQIAKRLNESNDVWPLTNDLTQCAKCAYAPLLGEDSKPHFPDNALSDDDRMKESSSEIENHPDL